MSQSRLPKGGRWTAKTGFATTSVSAALMLTIVFVLTPSVQAQTYNVLYNFTNGSDGATPIAGVTLDRSGNLYGTTLAGGDRGFGTAYRLMHSGTSWIFSVLYTFQGFTQFSQDGGNPYARVTIGPDGALYGTTHSGGDGQGCRELHGCGTIFKLQPKSGGIFDPWQETVLYQFGTYDGSDPLYGDVVFDREGNLFGATRNGGAYVLGAIYELTPNNGGWTESVVHSFDGADGSTPLSGPTLDPAGNLYGTTSAGGRADGERCISCNHLV